ncbi:hypothetical protein PPSIR1_30245 [Plesiocystis pacifica SIR-1]|uniref:Uncharacterized protein n=1 Tax=Plesiocystis pacifica SIR-1 TaxID=391625 RepID=A6FZ28_9BACT|nr:hypothetical protein [Plesiocystis pacifica]EDM81183.1 hypothetical protein PPSIR1_30245 [Plesiocystis pacifica SIR-1]
MAEVEGVRAWDQGGKLRIETVDVGKRLSLAVTKAKPEGQAGSDFSTSATGESPRLGASSGIDDSAVLRRSELIALLNDAATREGQRHGRPAAIAAGTQVAVGVRFEADKLELSVPRGHTIELDHANCCQALLRRVGPEPADGADPNFEAATLANGREVIRSKELGATPDLGGGGWLDVKVDGAVRRVWLDGAPARIELGADEAWTSSGGSLKLRLGGAGAWTTIELAAMPSLTRLAGAIVGGSNDLSVRLAYHLAFESAFPGGKGVELEAQREAYGVFSRARARDGRGGPALDCARAEGQGEAELSPEIMRVVGEPKPGYASAVTGPANAQVLELSGAGFNLRVHPATVDPFAFTIDGAKAKTAAFPPKGRAMGRRVLRYRVDMRATGGGADRQTWLQLVACPASVRAAGPVVPWLLDGEAKLDVEVFRGPSRTQVEVHLGWVADLARTLAARPNAKASEVAEAVRERIAATIQREAPLLRAWFVPSSAGARTLLQLETVGAGTGWRLRLTGAAVLRALGFDDAAISGAGVLEVLGVGNVADEKGVSADELRAAFDAAAAFTCESGHASPPAIEAHVLGAFTRRYGAQRDGKRAHLRLRSTSTGCGSSLAVLDGGAPFDFEPSLLRAPACNAAVVLPPPAATVTFAAAQTLKIRFDAGSGSPKTASLNLAAGTYDRTQLITALRGAVSSAWAGQVARFPDDKVVIETRTQGLRGAVELPHAGSSADIAAAFGVSLAAPTKARGWPGQDAFVANEAFRKGFGAFFPKVGPTDQHVPARGYRSRPIGGAVKPKKDVRWRFHGHDGTTARTSPELTLDEGWSAQTLATRVDQILGQGAPGNVRIGHAHACPDGSVQIEAASGAFLYFEFADVGGTLGPPGVNTPNPHTGERVDIKADPGLDLRMSDVLRTYRCVHDLRGEARVGEAGDFIDMGWHRPPTSTTWGITHTHTKSGTNLDNYPIELSAWPWGRVLLSARAEAAKPDGYADAGEMIVSSGTHAGVTFVHAARYWVGFTAKTHKWVGLEPLQLGVRTFAGEVLVDWVL